MHGASGRFVKTRTDVERALFLSLGLAVSLAGLLYSPLKAADDDNPPPQVDPVQPSTAIPTAGNPLQDLFTPQPQYKTPQALNNPQPLSPPQGETNPLKGLFTPQPQYMTPQALINPTAKPVDGEVNHFKGLYTPQPQYVTPQAIINPEAVPRFFIKERLPKAESQLNQNNASGPATVKAVGQEATAKAKEGAPKGRTVANPIHLDQQKLQAAIRQTSTLIAQSEYGKAESLLNSLLLSEPHDPQLHYLRAALYVNKHQYSEAKKEIASVPITGLDLTPDRITNLSGSEPKGRTVSNPIHNDSQQIQLRIKKISELIAQNDLAQAQSLLKTLAGEEPLNPQVHYLEAVLSVNKQQFAQARKELDTVVTLMPDSKVVQPTTGNAGRTVFNPIHSDAQVLQGRIREVVTSLAQGKYDQADSLIKPLLEQEPLNAQLRYLHAVLCVNKREYAEAQQEYAMVTNLAPNSSLSNMAKSGLAKIKP